MLINHRHISPVHFTDAGRDQINNSLNLIFT